MKPVTNEEIGDLIRAARWAVGMTQEALGEAIGLTHQQVQKYEKGRSAITAPRLVEVAQVLSVRAVDLLPERAR